MSPKKLEPKSRYAQYDLDGDGTVSDEELARNQELVEIELREEKADSQRRMAWVSLSSMVVFAFYHSCLLSQNPVCPLWLL